MWNHTNTGRNGLFVIFCFIFWSYKLNTSFPAPLFSLRSSYSPLLAFFQIFGLFPLIALIFICVLCVSLKPEYTCSIFLLLLVCISIRNLFLLIETTASIKGIFFEEFSHVEDFSISVQVTSLQQCRLWSLFFI